MDKFLFIYNKTPLQMNHSEEEPNVQAIIETRAPLSTRERIYFIMAKFISTKEYNELNSDGDESRSHNSGYSTPVKNSMLDESQSNNDDDEDDDDDEDENENESYDSVDSLKNPENSPPFKQAKVERSDKKSLMNSVYSSRMSMISNHDNVLKASHAGMNSHRNYIDMDNDYKKGQYLSTKCFLQLPSCLYRMKLHKIELDSFEASRVSVITEQVRHADFLQEFSILRQNYALQSLDQLNDLVMYIESAFKDVLTLEGDESAFLEILIINNIILFICEKFDDIYKNIEKSREILFNLAKCPLEIISMMTAFAGLLFERDNIIETEKEYLMALIHYFVVLSDPRGRGAYSSNFMLCLAWKSSMVAHYYKKQIDAELCEELMDAILYNLSQARAFVKHPRLTKSDESAGPSKKVGKMFGAQPAKNKFTKPHRNTPVKPAKRESNTKINIDDIDVDMLSNWQIDQNDPFDDLAYTLVENRFLFYHWNTYKDKVEDLEDYMKYGAGNQLDFFIYLLQSNPCMYMSGIKFTNTEIREFTFSDGADNMLNLKSTSSIMSGMHNMSSAMSHDSVMSDISNSSVRAKKPRSLHHGAYQHVLNKDKFGISRAEGNGVAYVWGTDTQGQLGSANISNMKFDDMDDDFKRSYPRILIGLKDLIIKEV